MHTAEQTRTTTGQSAMPKRHPVATKKVAACAHSTGAGGLFGLKNLATKAAQALLPSARCWLLALGLLGCLQVGAEGVGASAGGAGDSWREEVLLHDDQKMVIERSQTYGGRGEIGQDAPVADHTIRFTVPKGQQTVVWNSPFDRDVGRTSLHLLAVHVKEGTAYLITEPNLCLSYNKWGRPNPPYVVFQWQANAWQRIGIDALPAEFSGMNVSHRVARMWARDRNGTTVTATQIQQENATNQPQYRSILREPMPVSPCPQYSASPKAPD